MVQLETKRLTLRPLVAADFAQYSAVRRDSAEWLRPWEPRRPTGTTDPALDARAFSSRCSARERERQLGTGYAFGVFAGDQFVGELNVNSVQRGPFMNGYVGYWCARAAAGEGYIPEGLVAVFEYVFEVVGLHRLQIAIIPRNTSSRRVVEKLGLRCEGTAKRYLEINGVWEDHLRYAITVEEWQQRRGELLDWTGR